MTAPNALTNTYGGEHHWAHPMAHPLKRRTACPCSWFFFLWGAWGAGHVNYRPDEADRCSVAGTGGADP